MTAHPDMFDQPERLAGFFWGSIAFHVSLAAAVLAFSLLHGKHAQMGDKHGGGMGSVTVSTVSHIPLPSRNTPPNPVANPTESAVPTPPVKAKPKPKVRVPDPAAIRIPSHFIEKKPVPVKVATAAPNKFREQQKDVPNQVYSPVGQAVSSPLYQMPGAGGVGVGTNSPFGAQFGYYATIVRDRLAKNWKTAGLDPRIQTAPAVVVTFTIRRDGSVAPSSVRITQSSGISPLDISAQRAVLDAAPFPELPQQFPRSEADVEMKFELRR